MICDLEPYHILEHQGFKIGFVGMAEEAWLDQLMPEIDCSKLKYLDYNVELKKYSQILKDQGCDLIISLNHMRSPDDRNMAEMNDTSVVDMLFGGHDHCYLHEMNPNTGVYI